MKASFVPFLLGIILFGCSQDPVKPSPSPVSNTAKSKLTDANSLAEFYSKGLQLLTVASHQVHTDGTSSEWQYVYMDTAMPPRLYWFHADTVRVVFDSISAAFPGPGIIHLTWFDSDSALAIAERNGGSEFRTQNPHYQISASVGQNIVPNPKTYWNTSYLSLDDQSRFLMLSIDENSGAVTH